MGRQILSYVFVLWFVLVCFAGPCLGGCATLDNDGTLCHCQGYADNDGDGYVDVILVIHSGTGAEMSVDDTNDWSSAYYRVNVLRP